MGLQCCRILLCCCNIPLILWRNAKVCCCRWRTQKKILNYPVYHVIVNLLWPLWSSEWHYILFNANVRSLQLPSNYAVLLVSLAIKLWNYSKLYPKVICFFFQINDNQHNSYNDYNSVPEMHSILANVLKQVWWFILLFLAKVANHHYYIVLTVF